MRRREGRRGEEEEREEEEGGYERRDKERKEMKSFNLADGGIIVLESDSSINESNKVSTKIADLVVKKRKGGERQTQTTNTGNQSTN